METERQGNRAVTLVGDPSSKRSVFFGKAAKELGVPLHIVDWRSVTEEFDLDVLQGAAVKLDPPSYSIVHLSQMKAQLGQYQKNLRRLAKAGCRFLNAPWAICQMLDKLETSRFLKARGIPVTELLSAKVKTALQLEEEMRKKRCYGVFVKPRCFSGAAGVAAFRMHPANGKRMLYTSCRLRQGQLINTKQLACIQGREEIHSLLDELLSLGCVVERWHPKADFRGKSYDLRIVFQFGHIASMVARQSRGPITNLHLNNQAMEVGELGLDEITLRRIEEICEKTYEAYAKPFAGETVAELEGRCGPDPANGGAAVLGMDLLLEKGTMQPRVIELNGQGDLIYKDIYGENRIYKEQARYLSGFSRLFGAEAGEGAICKK